MRIEIKGIKLMHEKTETNLVFLDVSGTGKSAKAISDAALKLGVRIGAMGPMRLRAVTHLDVQKADIEIAAKALRTAVAS